MRTIFVIVYVIAIVVSVVGLCSFVFGDALDMGLPNNDTRIHIYVFDDKTQLWNRAKEETLRNATCEKLHTYVIGEGK